MTTSHRIVYMGTPDFAVAPLKALVEAGYPVVAVVTMPDKPQGRGHRMQYSPVKEYALSQSIPVLQPERLKDPDFLAQLASFEADLQIVVAFRMLPEVVWSMPRLGTFNLHASLLPQYRGAAPINWAIINGDTTTGVTTFMLQHAIDTGNILLQEQTPILPEDNVGTLHDRLMDIGQRLVVKTTDLIFHSDDTHTPLPEIPQIESPDLRPAPKIFKDTCRIDFSLSATAITNFVRGLSPYPAAWCDLHLGNQVLENVKVFAAQPIDRSEQKGHIILPCGQGEYIDLLELQLPGKKRMDARSLLNGLK